MVHDDVMVGVGEWRWRLAMRRATTAQSTETQDASHNIHPPHASSTHQPSTPNQHWPPLRSG
eukprot:scaffold81936_cov56-Cyclotella_meneghiniana.AAC.7